MRWEPPPLLISVALSKDDLDALTRWMIEAINTVRDLEAKVQRLETEREKRRDF